MKQVNTMEKNNLPWIVALAAVLLVAFMVYEQKSTTQNTIMVSGTADLKVDPDKADIYVTVEGAGIDASAAQAQLQLKSNKVIDAITGAGVDKKDIETTGFNVYPDYSYNPQTGENTIKGYKAQHSVHVVVKDLTKVGTVVDAVGGENGLVNNVQYGLTDEGKKSFDDDALQQATANAHQKAISLTKSAGTSLGKVVSISENNVYYPPFPYYARDSMPMEASGMMKSTDILPGDVTVSASVSVTYELG